MILFYFNAVLSRSIQRDGMKLSADFNVRVDVHRIGESAWLTMTATEHCPYFDEFDNPTSEPACFPGLTFRLIEGDEHIIEQARAEFEAWRDQLPDVIEFPDVLRMPSYDTAA